MPANFSSVSQLYGAVTQLAWTETNMAIHPRFPFGVADSTTLAAEGNDVANCAMRLRNKNPAIMDQNVVFSASGAVNSALAMFLAVEHSIANGLNTATIYAAVRNAIKQVDSVG
jgi:hypothetical protein